MVLAWVYEGEEVRGLASLDPAQGVYLEAYGECYPLDVVGFPKLGDYA